MFLKEKARCVFEISEVWQGEEKQGQCCLNPVKDENQMESSYFSIFSVGTFILLPLHGNG